MIYESKKQIIAEGGDITVDHAGQGKDLMSILSVFIILRT